MSEASPPSFTPEGPGFSPDGRFWWDGTKWGPTPRDHSSRYQRSLGIALTPLGERFLAFATGVAQLVCLWTIPITTRLFLSQLAYFPEWVHWIPPLILAMSAFLPSRPWVRRVGGLGIILSLFLSTNVIYASILFGVLPTMLIIILLPPLRQLPNQPR
jgi:hypothetical protein